MNTNNVNRISKTKSKLPMKLAKLVVLVTLVVTVFLCYMNFLTDNPDVTLTKGLSLKQLSSQTSVESIIKRVGTSNTPIPGLNNGNSNAASSDWCEFFQGDFSGTYGNEGKSIGWCGCGLCATCVVAEHFTGNTKKYLPNKMNHEVVDGTMGAYQSQYAITKFFSKHTEIPVTCSLKKSSTIDTKMLDDLLVKGGCLIVDYSNATTYNGSCVWTSNSGHYVVVCGGNSTDGYEVRDSNGGHNTGTRGVAAWAPYHKHKFPKQYITSCKYYYVITPK